MKKEDGCKSGAGNMGYQLNCEPMILNDDAVVPLLRNLKKGTKS